LADNSFRAGSVTLYPFFIDMTLFLPVKVEESTVEGRLQRSTTFESLSINTGVADGIFQLDCPADQKARAVIPVPEKNRLTRSVGDSREIISGASTRRPPP